MAQPGRQVLGLTIEEPLTALAGANPIWHVAGITLDWSLVPAVSGTAVTLKSGLVIPVGRKYLRYGQVLAKVTRAEFQTITEAGSPDGGTWAIKNLVVDGVPKADLTGLAFGISAAALQTALEVPFGVGNVTVGRTGTTTNFVWTVTAAGALAMRGFSFDVDGSGLTIAAAAGPTVATDSSGAGQSYGFYGPADTGATDGRQTLTNGECCVLNRTLLELNPLGLANPLDIVGALDGGQVWLARLLVGAAVQAPFANFPTLANLKLALPLLRYVQQ